LFQLYIIFSGSHRAVNEYGHTHHVQDEHDSGFDKQISQSGSQLQVGQLFTSHVHTLSQLKPVQGITGFSGSSGII
jgi:hypothetical protein